MKCPERIAPKGEAETSSPTLILSNPLPRVGVALRRLLQSRLMTDRLLMAQAVQRESQKRGLTRIDFTGLIASMCMRP
jgi:hypothetical protein